jgi:hypothetical protein
MAEKGATLRKWADKLAVEAEPGLTNAQLMVCVAGAVKAGQLLRGGLETDPEKLLLVDEP